MNVGVANSDPNPNSTYFNSKGMWVTYILVVAFIHYVFLSLPFLSVAMSWTFTNLIHNTVGHCLSDIIVMYKTEFFASLTVVKLLHNFELDSKCEISSTYLTSFCSNPADVYHSAHWEGHAVRNGRSGQVSLPHCLGAAGLWRSILRFEKISHSCSDRAVSGYWPAYWWCALSNNSNQFVYTCVFVMFVISFNCK